MGDFHARRVLGRTYDAVLAPTIDRFGDDRALHLTVISGADGDHLAFAGGDDFPASEDWTAPLAGDFDGAAIVAVTDATPPRVAVAFGAIGTVQSFRFVGGQRFVFLDVIEAE